MKASRIAVGAGVLILVGAAVLWSISHLEITEVQRKTGETRAVRADRFYAITHILSSALPVKRYRDPADISFTDAAVVVLDGSDLQAVDRTRMTTWISHGGRLIVFFTDPTTVPPASWWMGPFSALMPRFGAPPANAPSATAKPQQPSPAPISPPPVAGPPAVGPPAPPSAASQPSTASPQPVIVDVKLSFPDAVATRDTFVVTYQGETRIAVRHWGSGTVVVCGEPFFMENKDIGGQGDLDLADRIFGDVMNDTEKVAWFPPIGGTAAAPAGFDARVVVITALAALLLLMWMRAPRLGPVVPERAADRRSLRDRFQAEGRFLWRFGVRGEMIARLRRGAAGTASGAGPGDRIGGGGMSLADGRPGGRESGGRDATREELIAAVRDVAYRRRRLRGE